MQKTKLKFEDFSNVWKDNNDSLPSGLKLDLVEHLSRQRLSKEWVAAKERLVKTMKLDEFDSSHEIHILDIGCGLGIDLMLVAEEAMRSGRTVSITGLDQNSKMIEEAENLFTSQKYKLSGNVSIRIVRGDILHMQFDDETFDIVRSDITLQHVDLSGALAEIRRVLKVNGRLVALEGGAGDTYCSDEVVTNMYDTVLPSQRDGGTAIQMQFVLPKMGFELKSCSPMPMIQNGRSLPLKIKIGSS